MNLKNLLAVCLTATLAVAAPQLPLLSATPLPAPSVTTAALGVTTSPMLIAARDSITTAATTTSRDDPRSWHPFSWPSDWPFVPHDEDQETVGVATPTMITFDECSDAALGQEDQDDRRSEQKDEKGNGDDGDDD